MKIHREGYATIAIVLIFLSLINSLAYYFNPIWIINIIISVLSFVFFYLILHFFRNPERDIAINDKHILAPSDGKLVVIENVFEDEYLKEECTQLSIFMSPLNVHKQWYPTNGKVIYSQYHPGKYLVAWNPKSSTENERTSIVIQSNNHRILYRQIAGAVARRICNYAKQDDIVDQSLEAGFIKFGSRIDVLVPKSAEIKVKLDDIIVGGKTILAII
jgi:phosphatidylserine decarboxylase